MTPLELVQEQAEDEALWFDAPTATEAYLQLALRKLHAAIEAQPLENIPSDLPASPKECSLCRGLGMVNSMEGDPDDCPKCGGPGIDPEPLREALESISKNTCCHCCGEAKRVALAALSNPKGDEWNKLKAGEPRP